MSDPKRIQRKRTKGWTMPEDAVYVGRPTRWGNDLFPVGDLVDWPAISWFYPEFDAVNGLVRVTPEIAVAGFRAHVLTYNHDWMTRWAAPLGGRDLACWCGLCPVHVDGLPLGVECPDCPPCHADVLLELANSTPFPP